MLILAAKYWREIAVAMLVIILISAALYVKHVFAERDQLKAENSTLSTQLNDAAKMQELTNKFTEAISQIKIRSNVNVQRIETQPKPVFVDDSAPLVLISGGVLQAVYSSAAADRATPVNASGGDVEAEQPGG